MFGRKTRRSFWPAVPLLFSTEADERAGRRGPRPSCWGFHPIITRLGYPVGGSISAPPTSASSGFTYGGPSDIQFLLTMRKPVAAKATWAIAVTLPTSSYREENDKRPKIGDLHVLPQPDGRALFKSPVSGRGRRHFPRRWKTPRQGERNPTPLLLFFLFLISQPVSIYIRWPFQSAGHTIFAHLLNPLSSATRPHGTLLAHRAAVT